MLLAPALALAIHHPAAIRADQEPKKESAPAKAPVPAAAAQPIAPPLCITNARIEVGDGRVLEKANVVIRNGRIESIGEAAPPAGIKTLDAAGATIYPGFIDSYATDGLKLPPPIPSGKNEPDTLNTAPATMWHENRKDLRCDIFAADCIDSTGPYTSRYQQGVTTLVISSGNGWMCGNAAVVSLDTKPQVVNRTAGHEFRWSFSSTARGSEHVHDGYGGEAMAAGAQRSGGNSGYAYPQTPFGRFALMRQTIYDARQYLIAKPKESDATYEGLRALITGREAALFTVNAAPDIARAAHLADEFSFPFIINGVADAYRMVDVLKAHGTPVIVSLDIPKEPNRTPSGIDGKPKRVLESEYAQYKLLLTNAAKLDAAGIPIAFRGGRDAYLYGVRTLIENGLPRASALKALSLNPAKMFGVDDRLGTVEVGKIANLVLLSGDFADPKTKLQKAIVQGAVFDATSSAPATPAPSPFSDGGQR